MEIAVLDFLSNTVDIIDAPDNIEDIEGFLTGLGCYDSGHIFFLANDKPIPIRRYKAVRSGANTGDEEFVLEAVETRPETSYEAYIKSRMNDFKPGINPKEKAFAATFLSEINQGLNEKEFAKALCHEHPTIQQMFFRLVKQCFLTRAEERSYSCDKRNEASVRMCRCLADEIKKYPLPIK